MENKKNKNKAYPESNKQSNKPKWNDISNSPSMFNTMDDRLKHIFAAYLNLAQYNAFVHLNHIAKKMGITKRGVETKLSQHPVLKVLGKAIVKNNTKQIEPYKLADADYAMRQLFTEFPFLKVLVEWKRKTKLKQDDEEAILSKETASNKLDDNTAVLNNDEKLAEDIVYTVMSKLSITAQPDMLLDILSNMFDVLNYHRNHHTHYKHSSEKLDDTIVKNVALICNFALRSARRIVKTRFGVNPKDNPANEAKDFLYLKPNDLDFIAQAQDRFDRKSKKSKINTRFYYAMINDDKRLTSMGLVMLICMFLPRNYIMMFIDKLGEVFYGKFWSSEPSADTPEKKKHRRIMREIFGSFNLPMIKERYRSERDDIALALDMINELKKCPKLLYDHLSPNDQSKFKIGIDAKFNNNENSDDTAEIILTRHSDRFPYFALRYIDELKIFPFLRFHVNYGKYRFMLYDEKTCIDGSVQPRVLQYDLNGFGRLSEVEKIRSAEESDWLGENKMLAVSSSTNAEYEELPPDSPENLPYVTNCGTHYQFYGDKIGLRFLGLGDKNGNVVLDEKNSRVLMPPIETLKAKAVQKINNHENQAKTEVDENPIEVGVAPQCWLSTFELPAMAFYAWLTRKKELVQLVEGNDKIKVSPTEKIIWDCLSNYKKLFNQLGENKLNHFTRENLPNEVCGIKWKDIPQKIRDYMLSNDIQETQEPQFDEKKFLGYAQNVLKGKKENNIIGLVEQTQGVLTKFLDDFKAITGYEFSPLEYKFIKKDNTVKKNQAGRRSFTEIKPGRLSNYLARDIVALSSLSAKEKPTGLNYNIIQKAIAQYGGANGVTLQELQGMFEKLGLIDSHPFLTQVLNAKPANTLVLYYRYLICKINYLNELVQYVSDENVVELKKVSFLHSDQRRFHIKDKGYYAQLAEEYINRPIQLPTGLFTDAIRDLLIEDENLNKIVTNAENINAAWLIKQYHQTVLEDGMQPMYGFKRNYKLFDTLWPKKDKNGNPLNIKQYLKPNLRHINYGSETISLSLNDIKQYSKKYADIDIRAEFRRFDDHERLFRRYQVQDIVTFLMAKDILNADYPSRDTKNKEIAQNHEFKNIDKFKLKALCLKASKEEKDNILEYQVPFTVTLSIGEIKVEISQENMKIKNYGEFFRYVNDTRLVNLLPYLSDKIDDDGYIKIKRAQLEQELQAYDNNRVEIYKCVHDVEKFILNKFKVLENKYYTRKPDYSFEFHDNCPEKGNPVQNNFNAIVNYFDKIIQHLSTEAQLSSIMGEIRNAFSHNRYTNSDILPTEEVNAQLTQIAGRIKNIMIEKKKAKIKEVRIPTNG
ncbi:MAG: type VI-B CRISPR-associated RNA-guided ribonuclease Cas13b [Muribaculaceae bacterium]|nr:type VI-B CRISPR-associated RNA-guided ribonuclease Cas13b [Muribaculaceae bacterium]